MAVSVETLNIGNAGLASELVAVIEHVLSGRSGDWYVSVTGSRVSTDWELKVKGPAGFERSYTLTDVEHSAGCCQVAGPAAATSCLAPKRIDLKELFIIMN